MHWGLVKTIIVLPGTVLVFIPAVIVLLTMGSRFPPQLTNPSHIFFGWPYWQPVQGPPCVSGR